MNADSDEELILRHEGAQAGPHVMLVVSDTGHGMTQETLSHVFEHVETTKETDKENQARPRRLSTERMQQSKGFVRVSSTVGEGTTFRIYLPQVDEAVEVVEAPPIPPHQLHGAETILVVEDNDAVRRIAREFLKVKGPTIVEAHDTPEAIQIMENREERIDLVITDVLMPGMKGRELIERLAELRSDFKVLYMSAYTEDAAINIGVLSPGTEFIEKPFSPEELTAKVHQVLGRAPLSRHASAAQL